MMEYDINNLKEYGLFVEDGLAYTGGKEKLLAAIQRYIKGYEKNSREIAELKASGDVEGFKIRYRLYYVRNR